MSYVSNSLNPAVGTSSAEATTRKDEAHTRVISRFIRNTSGNGNIISLSRQNDIPAKNNYGIVLKDGDAFFESIDTVYKPRNDAISTISSAANGTLSIEEVVEYF
jgi:hypothetical protein